MIEILELNEFYKVKVLCEPQLGKRGLYPTLSQKNPGSYTSTFKMMEVLTWSDGKHDLIDISDKLSIPVWELFDTVDILRKNELICKSNTNFL